jgi:hypothetical protein
MRRFAMRCDAYLGRHLRSTEFTRLAATTYRKAHLPSGPLPQRQNSVGFRHLSPSIAFKRKFLAVDLAVSPAYLR